MVLNLAHIMPRSAANGPGERFVVWAQGCPLGCPGCWNPDTWSFHRRLLQTPKGLFNEIVSTHGIEGVTLTGGEPFAQAAAFAELALLCYHAGLSVFIFSGYELSELIKPDQKALLALTDVLVAGRYRRDQHVEGEPWLGSSNQTIHYLSSRYTEDVRRNSACAELLFALDGSIIATGFPAKAMIG